MSYTIIQHHGSYNRRARSAAVQYIVVHYTGSGTSRTGSALANCKYFAGGNRSASAHYFIDDGSIYEYADPSAYYTWHVGDGHGKYGITNANSIGIEVCNNGGAFTTAEIDRLTWLVQKLMAQFGVPASRVVRHYDASRKSCPAYYVDASRWNALHAQITGGSVSGGTTSTPTSNSGSGGSTTSSSGIAVDGLWGKGTTRALQRVLGTTADGIVSHQYSAYRSSNPGLLSSSWQWEQKPGGSSAVVKAMQRQLGVTADGHIGPATIKALQKHLGTVQDGKISKPSACVKALQDRLNSGKF